MFCNSKNDPDEVRPNVNVCPVCMAHPGTLPVINREAVGHVLRVGSALGSQLAGYTEFDRKNYFYPDLPKGYQISQYEFPLVKGGKLAGVEITRVHLEEDTASSLHDEESGETTIDFNRAGVPLMELVTEPVIASARQAGEFARELQLLLRYLGASEANMEKGEMRVEANVSISKGKVLGTKVEIKNLNSFRAMERAVAYEIKRQEDVLRKGGTIRQETRGWDEGRQRTFPQRLKEGSADYRYFPDPDLPSLRLSELEGFNADSLAARLPELPEARRSRYKALGINTDDRELYVRNAALGAFFDRVIETYPADKARITLASNYIANDLVSIISSYAKASKDRRDTEERDTELRADIPISSENFNTIIQFLVDKKISSRSAKDLLLLIAAESGRSVQDIAAERNLFQINNTGELELAIDKILAGNAAVVSEYRAGKTAALEYLVGQGMKALRGTGDPEAIRALILEKIAS